MSVTTCGTSQASAESPGGFQVVTLRQYRAGRVQSLRRGIQVAAEGQSEALRISRCFCFRCYGVRKTARKKSRVSAPHSSRRTNVCHDLLYTCQVRAFPMSHPGGDSDRDVTMIPGRGSGVVARKHLGRRGFVVFIPEKAEIRSRRMPHKRSSRISRHF